MADTPTPTGESIEKVTGTAQYIVDFTVPGMAYGKILRSPFAHAKIVYWKNISSSQPEDQQHLNCPSSDPTH